MCLTMATPNETVFAELGARYLMHMFHVMVGTLVPASLAYVPLLRTQKAIVKSLQPELLLRLCLSVVGSYTYQSTQMISMRRQNPSHAAGGILACLEADLEKEIGLKNIVFKG